MPGNNLAVVNFLNENGLKDAEIKYLPGDASQRRYARITKKNNQKFMLMIAPPEKEDIGSFVKVDMLLRKWGFNAPEILARNYDNGLLILQDFGDDLYSRVLRSGAADEREIYGLAVELLNFLPDQDLEVPVYSLEMMLKESVTFVDWFATEANREEFLAIMTRLIGKLDNMNNKLVLLDYHADNLIWLPGEEGFKKVGLLDFQDARIGHPAYDLVSLLEDARRDVDRGIVADILQGKPASFLRDYYILGAQRNLKIIGYFHRLHKRDGKAQYLDFLPRVWEHLRGDLAHPVLSELREWMIKYNYHPRA